MSNKKWLPLENYPDLLNKYSNGLGLSDKYQYCDVFGLDEELLAMVPQPVLAVLLCFPLTKENEDLKKKETEDIIKNKETFPKDLYHMKQTIGNACGTIGIIHSILNNASDLNLKDGFFKNFAEATKTMTPKERAEYLEKNTEVEEKHDQTAKDPTSISDFQQDTNIHFVCFVQKEGVLYELDGRREFPQNRGSCTPEEVLQKSVGVVKHYMSLNPEQQSFSITCLAKN
eukprot:gene10662-3286_t